MGELTVENLRNLLQEQTQIIKDEFQITLKNISAREVKTRERIEKLENRCTSLERVIRRNNIIIFGLEVDEEQQLFNYTIQQLNNLLKLNINASDVNNIRKIGRKTNPPIIVEFVRYQSKLEIFGNKETLQQLKGTNIAIGNDYCQADRLKHKILRKHLKIARQKNISARIRGLELEIDGKRYKPEELESPETDSEYETDQESDLENKTESEGGPSSSGIRKQVENATTDNSQTTEKKRKKETPSPTVKAKKPRKPKRARY